ncbi:SOS response-associated peptidase [Pedobacter sp. Leaf170]|uniref:SOS response-associated peptidase n=1 Tax=Pedobacter sp. Leaf170 TaxID=2876558 RepID=UPI001E56DA02|nr:SOS response-associated peptidase family protein [Pedobacter sp. Leaf170]
MCYTATQVTKAYDLQSHFPAKAVDPTVEVNLYKASGFDHPSLLVLLNDNGEDIIDLYQWGLMPTWNKPLTDMLALAKRTLNARSEDIRTTTSFKNAIKKQRCIIPVNSFFEYKHIFNEKGKKIDTLPYLIHPKEQPYFYLAGLYSYYKETVSNEWYKTFTIVTEPANIFMADIHNSAKRMPLMLSKTLIDDWINPDSPIGLIDDIMQFACSDDDLAAYRVVRELKSAPNDKNVLREVSDNTQSDLFS